MCSKGEACSRKRTVRRFFLVLSSLTFEPKMGKGTKEGEGVLIYTCIQGVVLISGTQIKVTNIQEYQLTFSTYWFYQALKCHN